VIDRILKTTKLTVEVEYDPRFTDPESLACAMDRLLETALSTPGIMEDYGPRLGPFALRSEALAAEQHWLEANWLPRPSL
jgi:hypothetical protein